MLRGIAIPMADPKRKHTLTPQHPHPASQAAVQPGPGKQYKHLWKVLQALDQGRNKSY